MDKIKATIIAIVSMLMSWLGILAVPVLLLVGCNIMDYITGLMAAGYRDEDINSYKSIRGIMKKVCMWLLIIIGVFVDILIKYAVECAGITLSIPFIVATVVSVWLVVNEIISILENMLDMQVNLPPFLLPIVKYIRRQTEELAKLKEGTEESEGTKDEE